MERSSIAILVQVEPTRNLDLPNVKVKVIALKILLNSMKTHYNVLVLTILENQDQEILLNALFVQIILFFQNLMNVNALIISINKDQIILCNVMHAHQKHFQKLEQHFL